MSEPISASESRHESYESNDETEIASRRPTRRSSADESRAHREGHSEESPLSDGSDRDEIGGDLEEVMADRDETDSENEATDDHACSSAPPLSRDGVDARDGVVHVDTDDDESTSPPPPRLRRPSATNMWEQVCTLLPSYRPTLSRTRSR